jgi:hypothetical protein
LLAERARSHLPPVRSEARSSAPASYSIPVKTRVFAYAQRETAAQAVFPKKRVLFVVAEK